MNTRLSVNLSLLGTFLMLALSFSFGFHSYSEAKRAVVTDLNQALRQTLLRNSPQWMSRDSIRTYAHLSELFGSPVTIESYNLDFAEALRHTPDRERSGIAIQIHRREQEPHDDLLATEQRQPASFGITSDTLIWTSTALPQAGAGKEEIGITFQGYANCSPLSIIGLANKSLPGLFLGMALLFATTPWLLKRKRKIEENPLLPEESVAFGNLRLVPGISAFRKADGEKLRLTPQQYALLEMFFLSPTHILSRTDICEQLWPGKINADETLNTLVRRLRPLIEAHSNLKITTDRGRAYILETRD